MPADFLKYVQNSTDACVQEASDETVRRLHEKVKTLKKSRELEENFMYLTEWLEDERKEGREEGQQSFLKLISHMTEDGALEEIPRLSKEPEFLKEMLQKYHL